MSKRKTSNDEVCRTFKPKGHNQTEYVRSIIENDIVFCVGPSGSGKTACAVGLAIGHLVSGKVDKIVITRPTIGTEDERGGLGYIPGSLRDKMDVYLIPIYDELLTYINETTMEKLISEGKIEIAPLDFMRGRTFHNAFVIMDEAQNATHNQIKMFVTRLGKSSKMIVNGDMDQHDRKRINCSLYEWIHQIVIDIPGIHIARLEKCDIVRHKLVSYILTACEKIGK